MHPPANSAIDKGQAPGLRIVAESSALRTIRRFALPKMPQVTMQIFCFMCNDRCRKSYYFAEQNLIIIQMYNINRLDEA